MSCGRSTDFFLRLSLSLEARLLLNPPPLLHQSVAQGDKVGVLAFWKGGKKASSKTMELGRGTHDKGEQGARSRLRMPKNKNKKCSAVFLCSRLASKQPRFIEGVKPRPARCKAAAGVQGRGGAGARSGKVHARGRGRAVPTHTMGAFQLVTGARRAQHPQLWQTPYSTYHWQCAHRTSYWLSTPCFFLLSPFLSFPSSPPHVLRALSAPPPSRYSSPIRTAADSGDGEARLRGGQLQASRHKIENQLVSPPYTPVTVTVTVPPTDCSPIRLLSDASGL
jgi:hypothetical protein